MNEERIYNDIRGNFVTLNFDGCDYDVSLNGFVVLTTGDETEAEIAAEALDIALAILDSQGLLNDN